MKIIILFARILFSFIFIVSGMFHFSNMAIQHGATFGVPMASVIIPFSGLMAIVGSLLIILGYKAKIGAWLIVAFLIPVTFTMHQFWTITDPMSRMIQMVMFEKNLSMLGGALIITVFGSGAFSLDNKFKK